MKGSQKPIKNIQFGSVSKGQKSPKAKNQKAKNLKIPKKSFEKSNQDRMVNLAPSQLLADQATFLPPCIERTKVNLFQNNQILQYILQYIFH